MHWQKGETVRRHAEHDSYPSAPNVEKSLHALPAHQGGRAGPTVKLVRITPKTCDLNRIGIESDERKYSCTETVMPGHIAPLNSCRIAAPQCVQSFSAAGRIARERVHLNLPSVPRPALAPGRRQRQVKGAGVEHALPYWMFVRHAGDLAQQHQLPEREHGTELLNVAWQLDCLAIGGNGN